MADNAPQAVPFPSSFAPTDASPPRAGDDVSVFGILLLSTFSVGMAIIGMLLLGLMVMGIWWLVSHIPVPPALRHLLALL